MKKRLSASWADKKFLIMFNYIENKLRLDSKKNFSVIFGNSPSKNARSPKIWNKIYKKINSKTRMYPFDVSKNNFVSLIDEIIKNNKFIGGSVTEPFKADVVKQIRPFDNLVKKIGAANTILKHKNNFRTYNTDFLSIVEQLQLIKKIKKNVKKVLILGCGGVGKATIVAASNSFKTSKIYVYSRDSKKNNLFKKNIKKKNIFFKNFLNLRHCKNFDLVINTTTIGFNKIIKYKKISVNYKNFSPIGFQEVEKKINTLALKEIVKKNVKFMKVFFKNNKDIFVLDLIYGQKNLLKKFVKKYNILYEDGSNINKRQALLAFSFVNNIDINKIVKISHDI